MIIFIVVPKNSGLKKYREIALKEIGAIDPSKVIEVRGEDVPFWLKEFERKGKKAIGLTGEDLYREFLLEERENVLKIIKRITWNDPNALFNKPILCLIGPKDKDLSSLPKALTIGISSKYIKLAKKYLNFLERNGFSFRKFYMNGCIEAVCSEGIADLIIDIVYTGSSIEKYGLKVYDKIIESDFLILSNNPAKSIIFDMDGVLIDTSNSYSLAAKKTMEFFVHSLEHQLLCCTSYGTQPHLDGGFLVSSSTHLW